MRLPPWLAQHLAALRALLVFTVLLGLVYPLAVTAVAQLPGLRDRAAGSILSGADGGPVGSRLIGQSFTDADGEPIPWYVQSRPSAAGGTAGAGYDPTASAASNLGPESIEDTLAADPDDAAQALLTLVCTRSLAIGELEGVDGGRPYCTDDGVGAVLRVFYRDGLTGPVTRAVSVNQPCPSTPFLTEFATEFGTEFGTVAVECARVGEDYSGGVLTPVRGDAPADPAVPADAVTASGSGLDPHISVAYALLQAPRVARERGAAESEVRSMIDQYTDGRVLGFMGEPRVRVLELNLALDRRFPTG